jgi:hypothetical protein
MSLWHLPSGLSVNSPYKQTVVSTYLQLWCVLMICIVATYNPQADLPSSKMEKELISPKKLNHLQAHHREHTRRAHFLLWTHLMHLRLYHSTCRRPPPPTPPLAATVWIQMRFYTWQWVREHLNPLIPSLHFESPFTHGQVSAIMGRFFIPSLNGAFTQATSTAFTGTP